MYVFKYRRVCHIHFESKYWTRSKMLSNIAVPTLHITVAITERVPLAELANNSVMSNYMNITAASASSSSLYSNIINSSTSITNYMEESPSPSTSAFLYSGTMKTPTSRGKQADRK
ncbi:uncharacterized protein LOC124542402 [Vanessa cardui]|uniref:uncharacterized protein LOC124542402 n=1 Tax=Vanessa cardui TaxID=171605 RepID=UPI001F142E7B|nr:uncharacterized protein LOC124542402 [Vanessa cardui]